MTPQMRQLAVLHQAGHDLEIVRGLERRRQDQRLALDLVHRVLELGAPVGRVDVDQHEARLRRGELCERPLGGIWRPDADPVAALQPQGHQPGGQIVDPAAKLAPAPAYLLVAHDQRLAVAMALDLAVEEHADRLADQLPVRDAVVVGDFWGSLSIGHAGRLARRVRFET
jgi:hypothetical protein